MSENPDHPIAGRTRAGAFAPTRWTMVLAAGDQASADAAEALETLCRTYWYPLYAFVRRKGYSPPDAEDLTQGFFAHLLKGEFPAGVKPQGGKFRSYLLTAFQHFLHNEWNRGKAQKRGGGQTDLSLQELDAEGRYRLEPVDDATPESLFDRRWATVLLERCRERLREEYTADGKADLYQKLQHCLTGAERSVPYATLATELGSSESAVKMAVHRLRKRFGKVLRLEIGQTVSSPEAVEDELSSLLAVL